MNTSWIYALELTLIGLAMFWLWAEYRSYRLDLLRQNLFKIRDDLFAKAASGAFPIDSMAHRMMRSVINGSIRYAHELSFANMLAVYIVAKSSGRVASAEFRSDLASALSELPNHQSQKIVMTALDACHLELAKHLLMTSPAVWILTPVMLAWSMLKSTFNVRIAFEASRRFARQKFRHLDPAVYEGEICYRT